MGIIGIPETNNIEILHSNEVKDSINKSYFGITLLLSDLVSKIAIFEYLDVATALNKSIEEDNDTESIIVLAKQLKSLSVYKPGPSTTMSMSRDELRESVDAFIKAHVELFSVKVLEDLLLKVENL